MAKRCNTHTVRYGNENGEIRFGHIHDDNELSGVMLRTGDDGGRHYMTMDSTGDIESGRKGSTTNVSPGTYSIKAGRTVDDKVPAIFQYAENGDILIGSPKGRIRLWAQNIEIKADGTGGGSSSTSWTTRDLNQETDPGAITSISSCISSRRDATPATPEASITIFAVIGNSSPFPSISQLKN